MRALSRLEAGLAIGAFLLEVVNTWAEVRKRHDLQDRVDNLEEKVQSLEKAAKRRGRGAQ